MLLIVLGEFKLFTFRISLFGEYGTLTLELLLFQANFDF